ncbi:ImmA/IrrE family metallo-endopeptidase [Aneurinibacillus sp. BA2021]|nr:ImmA/IrrE family metallo-endopeptidase [Aneurinibacillus sp. BA2021]
MKPRKCRLNYVKAKALMHLNENNIKHPPVNVMDLIKKVGKVKQRTDIEEGATFYHEKRKKYYIVINPTTMKERKNWTLCHELGHIVLGHLTDYDVDNLTDEEHKILEREADVFVRELLMPKSWIEKYYEHPLTIPKLGRLKNIFDVSWTAIINRLHELNLHTKEEINNLFKNWYNKDAEKTLINEETFIDIVDNDKDTAIIRFETKEGVHMSQFKFPEMDENKRFLSCPNCNNTNFSSYARYCKICGYYLFNDCKNVEENNYWQPCGESNVPDALYCEYCGTQTMMGELVESMNLTREEVAAASNERIAFSDNKPIEISDDDLPF